MSTSTTDQAIAERLRTLAGGVREGGAAGMARRIGMEEANVRRYVAGKVGAPHDFLLKVAGAYGVTLDYLYARDGAPAPDDPTMPAWARRLESRIEFLERKLSETAPGQDLTVEEIVKIAVEAARRPRATATRAEGGAPDRSAGGTGARVR
jgi:transcriptional regulator with XRE-family HTH domain